MEVSIIICRCFTGLLALADYPIPGSVYSWIAVLVLPINSAVNPVLYTLSEQLQKKVKKLLPFDNILLSKQAHDVEMTSRRHDNVASTVVRRHFDVMCQLGYFIIVS